MNDERPNTFEIWSNERTVPGARLAAFESWLFEEMSSRLVWPREEAARAKMIGQCRTFVMAAVADLARHGYLFKPKQLAALLREKLDQIGELQRQGKVENLYPYFRACWDGWVRRNAEELRDQAMSTGVHIGQIMNFFAGLPVAAPSIPELVSENLRLQASLARRRSSTAYEGPTLL